MFVITALLIQQSGVQKIAAGIPHDPAAIFIYIFLAVSLYLIWRGSRSKA